MRRRELELRDVRNFLAMAETLHFGRAATELRIAQPVLSKQIKQLELMLGCQLFERRSKGVKLTYAGEFFRRRAEALRASAQDAVRMVRRIEQGEEGRLVVGVCPSILFTAFSDVVQKFRDGYPEVSLELKELNAKNQIEQLNSGTLDIGFMRDGKPTEGLRMRRLQSESLAVILPQRHPLAGKETLQPADLKEEPLVLFLPAKARLLRIFPDLETRPNVVQEVHQWSSALSLVRSGVGLSIAPSSLSILRMEGTTARPLLTSRHTTVDVATFNEITNPTAKTFMALAVKEFAVASQ